MVILNPSASPGTTATSIPQRSASPGDGLGTVARHDSFQGVDDGQPGNHRLMPGQHRVEHPAEHPRRGQWAGRVVHQDHIGVAACVETGTHRLAAMGTTRHHRHTRQQFTGMTDQLDGNNHHHKCVDPGADDPLRVVRAYDDGSPVSWELGYRDTVDWPRTVGEVFTTFQRTNFRVDQILEPTATGASLRGASYADLMRSVPATLLVRARKQGN